MYKRIETELRGISVGILGKLNHEGKFQHWPWICHFLVKIPVNCVGRMYEFPDEFSNVPMEILWSLIKLNVGAMITMTRIVVNGMKERKKGAIINISSGSELMPCPFLTVYAATKVNFSKFDASNFWNNMTFISQAFVRHFTLGLQYELDSHGIFVQLLTPFCVQTNLHTYPVNEVVGNIFFPTVETFVKSAVFTLGKSKETTGYWAHSIMVCILKLRKNRKIFVKMRLVFCFCRIWC